MEKHRCKLCYRKFANGRALGGHMRSHMMNLPVSSKPGLRPGFEGDSSPSPPQTPSYSSSSGSEPEEGEIVVKGKLLCKLSDHDPKRSVKLVENHNNISSSFVGVDNDAAGSSSVTLQDRESETESSRNVTRRRSKRTRKPASLMIQYGKDYQSHDDYDYVDQDYKLLRDDCYPYNNDVDQQPGSSISEVTSEEDVAFCLMMMSRDKWNNENRHEYGHRHRHDDDEKECNNNKNVGISYKGDVTIVSGNNNSQQQQKKRYKCETCNKVFRSYQALGGHRASHKKLRLAAAEKGFNDDDDNEVVMVIEEEKKIHECPICYRVFASGQALGGHKRSHVTANAGIDNNNNININPVQLQVVQSPKKKKITSGNFIDLNLPAPVDDDEDENISHTTFSSAVSEFINDCKKSK